MTEGWTRSDFFALCARLNAKGIEAARPPEDGETAGAYLAMLYGWMMDACEPKAVLDEPRRAVRATDHLIDHDAAALLRGETLDPKRVGVSFTYRRGG